ncbi:MAG: EamA family transporter [Chloroflexi bacterium]|nr:EamA family transporter [Chloroflexota bacterium]
MSRPALEARPRRTFPGNQAQRARFERGHWLALLTAGVWGTLHSVSKFALAETGPAQLTFMRVVLATLVLLGICLVTGQLHSLRRASRRDWLALIALGVFGGSMSPLFAMYSLRLLPASVAGFFSNTSPLLIAFIAPAVLHERLGRGALLGILLGFAGVLLIVQPGSGPSGMDVPVFGAVLAILSSVTWAGYMVVGRYLMGRHRPIAVTTVSSLVGTAGIGLVAFVDGGLMSGIQALPEIWPIVLWVGLVANGLGFGAWMVAISRLGAGRVAAFQYLVPVVGTLMAFLVLDEEPTPVFIAGGALILLGVGLSQTGRG